MQQKEISRWLKAITIVLALMGAVFFRSEEHTSELQSH